MRRPAALPDDLPDHGFSVAEARRRGAGRRRLEASDLVIPYRGARLRTTAIRSIRNLAAAYAARMPPTQFFSHSTAALLNDVPLPLHLEHDRRLHVSVFTGSPQPRVRGIVGHQVDPGRTAILTTGGLRLTDAATTWCQLAALVTADDLVAAGDFLITGTVSLGGTGPTATISMLEAAVEAHRGSVGAAQLRAALQLIRVGPLSRRETLLRLRIARAGLPEPELNFEVRDQRLGSYAPMVDLAYPEYRIAIEYEGDHHRTPEQFRRDIRRYERLQDIGWIVVRVSASDVPELDGADSLEVVQRIASRLRRRGWRG